MSNVQINLNFFAFKLAKSISMMVPTPPHLTGNNDFVAKYAYMAYRDAEYVAWSSALYAASVLNNWSIHVDIKPEDLMEMYGSDSEAYRESIARNYRSPEVHLLQKTPIDVARKFSSMVPPAPDGTINDIHFCRSVERLTHLLLEDSARSAWVCAAMYAIEKNQLDKYSSKAEAPCLDLNVIENIYDIKRLQEMCEPGYIVDEDFFCDSSNYI